MIKLNQKGVLMLVSAISMCENSGIIMNSSLPFYYNQKTDPIADTSFNSLSPYATRKATPKEKLPQMYDAITEWQNFCHDRIIGEKLDIIA